MRPAIFGPKGTVTVRDGILAALREAEGKPIHMKDIWERAKSMGVESNAVDPMAIFDGEIKRLMVKNSRIKKFAPRTYLLEPEEPLETETEPNTI